VQTALKLQGVEKSFGEQKAVTALELSVPRGETCGLIGPSGAGKTTSIRLIMSILFPDAGTVEVLGQASALQAKDRIGYLPEERGVYRKMKVWAFLKYLAGLKGMPESASQPRANARRSRARVSCWAGSASRMSKRRSARIFRKACCSACSSSAPSCTSPSC
jgi:ABC-2 type transport system ATP-binding protein